MIDFRNLTNIRNLNFDHIPIDSFWNIGDEKELKMHRIHAYPAKFPAFITTKALKFARDRGVVVKKVADIFCGCGTVAFEARRNDISFWGCDINPVATMIARAKSEKYQTKLLKNYYDSILNYYDKSKYGLGAYQKANERLKYWYDEKQFENILQLKKSIESAVPKRSRYLLFFLCAFSNILKPTSRWLTKSIKPQIDPEKEPADVIFAFKEQCRYMLTANDESDIKGTQQTKIVTANFLHPSMDRPIVDMIITSPPYVTSYEYADLHQLSSLWLNFVRDYRDLREGTIGSLHHNHDFDQELKELNSEGKNIVSSLLSQDKAKARSVAKYFLDMQQVTKACHDMLSEKGMALFVIGNTEYKGVRIDNAKHLSESLLNSGFKKLFVTKRKILGKILTPYRDKEGRFSTDKDSRKVYGEEFIVVGRKS